VVRYGARRPSKSSSKLGYEVPPGCGEEKKEQNYLVERNRVWGKGFDWSQGVKGEDPAERGGEERSGTTRNRRIGVSILGHLQ